MATIIGNAISVSINNKIVLSKNQHDWKLDEHGFIIGEDVSKNAFVSSVSTGFS